MQKYFNKHFNLPPDQVNSEYYGFSIEEHLYILDFTTMCVVFLKTTNQEKGLNIIVDRPYDLIMIETDDYFIYGVSSPKYKPKQLSLLAGFRLRGEGVSEEYLQSYILDKENYKPDKFLWIKKSVLLSNRELILKISSLNDTNKRLCEMQKPEASSLSEELKRSAQEYYDLAYINQQLK